MIEIYQSIHGKMPGFKEDMEEIAKNWDTITFDERVIQINSVIVKYRNQRANGTVKSEYPITHTPPPTDLHLLLPP